MLGVIAGAAQPAAARLPTIGVLLFTEVTEAFRTPFREGLRAHGYVEGQNVAIEWRGAGGRRDNARAIADELVRLKVDVIVASLTPAVQAAKEATATIPIVMAPAGDPVRQGFVATLARPGRNITGVTGLSREASGKRLQLVKEIVPRMDRVGVLLNGADPFAAPFGLEHERATKAAGIQLAAHTVSRPADTATALAAMARDGVRAVIVQPSLIVSAAHASQIAKQALQHGLAAVSQSDDFTTAGALMSYGASFPDLYRRAAGYVDRILKGASPADLPVQQATTFELVVNLKTAKALGLTIPPSLLLQTDRVVE